MRRLGFRTSSEARDERGAVAVITAISMVTLLGMAAIVIDVGAIYFERTQLQTGADAAAIAIAQNCAKGDCGDISATATSLAGGNANDGASAADASVDTSQNLVSVNTGTLTSGGQHALANVFAPILGFPTSSVRASASATWGSPAAATVFPFTTPECIYDKIAPNTTVWLKASSSCTDANGNVVPGGFGWLDETSPCAADVDITSEIGSEPGKSGPPCSMDKIVNTTILIPVYAYASGQGQNAVYTIYGFAAFHLTDWSWPGSFTTHPSADCDKCTGVQGYFTQLVSIDDIKNWSIHRLGGPTLNASFVSLSQ